VIIEIRIKVTFIHGVGTQYRRKPGRNLALGSKPRRGSVKAGLGTWPRHWLICWWFAGSQPSKAGVGENVFYRHLHLARLEFSMPNNVDIDCLAGHFAQLLNINYLRLLC